MRRALKQYGWDDLEGRFNHFTVLVDLLDESLKKQPSQLAAKLKEVESSSYTLLGSLLEHYRQVVSEVESAKVEVGERDQFAQKIMRDYKRSLEVQKEDKRKGTLYELRPLEEKVQCLVLENMKLKDEVERLGKKFEVVQTDNDVQRLKQEYRKMKDSLSTKNAQLEEKAALQEQHILSLQVLVNNMKNANKELDKRNKEYRQEYDAFTLEKQVSRYPLTFHSRTSSATRQPGLASSTTTASA